MAKGTFIHIPKNAGTTFREMPEFNYGVHANAGDLILKFPETKWFFTIFRSPEERFISAFRFVGMKESIHHKVGTDSEHMDYSVVSRFSNINYFIFRFATSVVLSKLFGCRRLANSIHFSRQVTFLRGAEGVPTYALDIRALDKGFPRLMKNLGLEDMQVPAHLNKSQGEKPSLNFFGRLFLRFLYWPDYSLFSRLSASESGWIRL